MHQSGDQLQKSGDEIDRAAANHLLKNQPFKKNRLAATVAPTVAHRCAAAPLRRTVAHRCAPLCLKKNFFARFARSELTP